VIRRNYTFAADIWSVGCTVLEMLTGVMPYSALSNDFAVIRIGVCESE
jgi:mitogen-activated protein kinase kinase kinase 1